MLGSSLARLASQWQRRRSNQSISVNLLICPLSRQLATHLRESFYFTSLRLSGHPHPLSHLTHINSPHRSASTHPAHHLAHLLSGGVAGGTKFIVQGILFKFALDDHGIYGGDENAQKAASHDLKGLMAYSMTEVGRTYQARSSRVGSSLVMPRQAISIQI